MYVEKKIALTLTIKITIVIVSLIYIMTILLFLDVREGFKYG